MEAGCETTVEVNTVLYKWKINNAQSILNLQYDDKERGELLSPVFSVGRGDQWRMELFLNGSQEKFKGNISICLSAVSGFPDSGVHIDQKFFILDVDGAEELTMTKLYRKVHLTDAGKSWGYNHFSTRADLLENATDYLPNDTLTICCEVTVYHEFVTTAKEYRIEPPKIKIIDDFRRLYENHVGSDVILVAGNEEIQAHKAILMVRSPVFAAMFSHDMVEQQQHRVEMNDIRPDILRAMLEYIYTDQCHTLNKVALELLAVADKYALEGLKLMCGKAIFNNINTENAAETLLIADRHGATQLMASARDFINSQSKAVLKTSGFQMMAKSDPHLVVMLYQDKVDAEKPAEEIKKCQKTHLSNVYEDYECSSDSSSSSSDSSDDDSD